MNDLLTIDSIIAGTNADELWERSIEKEADRSSSISVANTATVIGATILILGAIYSQPVSTDVNISSTVPEQQEMENKNVETGVSWMGLARTFSPFCRYLTEEERSQIESLARKKFKRRKIDF